MNCLTCKYAEWQKTTSGRNHPNGMGQCGYTIKVPVLPKAFYYIGGSKTLPLGGFIDRNAITHYDGCLTYQPKLEGK